MCLNPAVPGDRVSHCDDAHGRMSGSGSVGWVIVRRVLTGPIGLWGAFLIVHAWLGWLALNAPGWPLGDVQFTYSFWVEQAIETGRIVGIDTDLPLSRSLSEAFTSLSALSHIHFGTPEVSIWPRW